MADGFFCKHCGYQQADHEFGGDYALTQERIQGLPFSLAECPGFEVPDEDKPNAEVAKNRAYEQAIRDAKNQVPYC